MTLFLFIRIYKYQLRKTCTDEFPNVLCHPNLFSHFSFTFNFDELLKALWDGQVYKQMLYWMPFPVKMGEGKLKLLFSKN